MKDPQQKANKRWRESSPEKKEHSNYLKSRTAARSFIRTKATLEDIQELKNMLNEKENLLKIEELIKTLKGSSVEYAITIWESKKEIWKNWKDEGLLDDEDSGDMFNAFEEDFGRFDEDEKIVSVNTNGIPKYFSLDEYDEIYELV